MMYSATEAHSYVATLELITSVRTLPPQTYRVVYFIPQNAIDAYPGKLTQNPTH